VREPGRRRAAQLLLRTGGVAAANGRTGTQGRKSNVNMSRVYIVGLGPPKGVFFGPIAFNTG